MEPNRDRPRLGPHAHKRQKYHLQSHLPPSHITSHHRISLASGQSPSIMKFLLSPLLLLLIAAATSAQFFGSSNNVIPDGKPKNLNVTTSVKFVNDDSQQLGVRLVNGVPTKVNVHIHNFEEKPIIVRYVGGSLIDPVKGVAVKNFTSLKVGATVGRDRQVLLFLSYCATVELIPRS